ncbi:TniB family NTP-binding protein [Streptomyces sp. NPDC090741]|uniref:TniB family NTP-binding protein n=1 Tax=Streptomyces sp. NPDC090741 TaxID=3365967 RepID=UPI0037F7068E
MTTWQGWQQFVHTPALVPPAPDTPPRSVEERMAYHSAFVTVRTPAIDTLATNIRTLMILGRYQQTTARPSLILTGPAAAGKTTALLHVGRTCHLAHTRTASPPGKPSDIQVPVAYVLVPPGATAKMLAAEFARYLDVPITARMTQTQITESVCHTYNQTGVRLVLIDEIHRVNPRTTTGAETADLIKDLTERIQATFVYAGIDVTSTPLFTGVRGAQLAGRASLIECGPLPARLGNRHPFTDTVTDLENALDLHHHRPGTLPRHATYLHQRTAGRIGSLTRLIRQAAIHDGTERITKAALDAIRLDHHAETTHLPRTRTTNRRTPPLTSTNT